MKIYEPRQVRKKAAINRNFCVNIYLPYRGYNCIKIGRGNYHMTYTALYRKFRPKRFDEMVGQEHITRTIKNQITAGRVGHAYLFNGGRGTGKTSAAKILARAVNCLNSQDGEPCNECEICKGALNGTLTDIVEMDAASNNSVEDIRGIREEVNFLPTLAKYRVYIIDEVHMLSTGAFNALLKTLEEPPAHVKFILATTEPQKLPATILSRCQRFDFKKISTEDVVKRLEIICKETEIEATPEALKLIAILSEGAMRDAISILERCIQDGETKISEEKIKELVGIPKFEQIQKLVNAILEYNIENAIEVTETIIEEGKDISNVIWENIKYIKDVLVYKTTQKLEIYNKEEIEQIKELSQKASTERLLKLICELSELENRIKYSTQRQLVFQAGIIGLCNKSENYGYEELEKRIANLENGIKIQPQQGVKKVEPIVKKEEKPKIVSKAAPTTPGQYLSNWTEVVNKLKQNGKIMLYTNLINTRAKEINDMTVGIEFNNGLTSFGRTIIENPDNMRELETIISTECGKPMRIKLLDEKSTKIGKSDSSDFDIPINIIEE